jgi:hypothetical protein
MAAAAAVTGSLLLTVGCSSSGSSSGATGSNTSSGANWATATSAAAGGGMNALVAAAKKEGTLNVITLPANWANYGTIMKDFTAKYGIKINDANPDGSSQDELNAVNQLKGQDRAPYAAYYDQAISKFAPHPAAARLWEEYLYSTTGQNLWLQGEARPIELSTLVTNGTVDQAAYKALPPAPAGNVTFPTQAQQAAAENIVASSGLA